MLARDPGNRPSGPWRPADFARALALSATLGGLAWSVAGCETIGVLPPVAIAGTVEGVALNQSGKTVSDHIASWVTGGDCSILRATAKNGKYCMTEAEVAQQNANLHRLYVGTCYKTRGGVDCYDDMEATHTSETQVYNNP